MAKKKPTSDLPPSGIPAAPPKPGDEGYRLYLLAQEGRHVVIHAEDPVEVVDTYDDALKVGYEKFGLSPFLVRQISRVEKVANFTHFSLIPCRA